MVADDNFNKSCAESCDCDHEQVDQFNSMERRPPLRRNCLSSSSSNGSSRSMIGSFRSTGNECDSLVCEKCDTHDIDDQLVDNITSDTYSYDAQGQAHHSDDNVKSAIQPVWTRTTFVVKNMCCSSEVPVIQTILEPYNFRSVGIAVTTKRVTVTYDTNVTSTEEIRKALTDGGFPAKVVTTETIQDSNNNNDNDKPTIQPIWTRTTFVVQNMCCSSEVPVIRKVLESYSFRSVGIAVTTKRVTVTYDHNLISTEEIRNILTDGGFPARVVATETIQDTSTNTNSVPGSSDNRTQSPCPTSPTKLRKIKASSYVESTISISSNSGGDKIHDEALLQRIMKQNYSPSFVRASSICAIISNNLSYVKIEHNPDRVSIKSIMKVITQSGLNNVSLITDGAVEGLYLPERKVGPDASMEDVVYEDDPFNNTTMTNDSEESSNSTMNRLHENNPNTIDANNDDTETIRMELHVILSGFFWVICMIASLIPNGSAWKYLEYTGVLSVIFGLPPVLRKAFQTFRRGQFDANCMMSTAAVGACILGEWDEAASVSFLFSVSDYMEVRASSRARRALQAIVQLRPDHASVIDEVTKVVSIIPASLVPIHSLLSVRTGDKIAADGVVIEGTSLIDQSSLTGESVPLHVTVGSTVSGGSINVGTAQLHIRTTASVQDSAVSRLIRLVEDAQSNRSPTEKLVDTFARAYTPAVVCTAILLATIPWLWGNEIGRMWTLNALILIVIACPCALTISTPVTYAAGLAATAQRGIVCKGGATLEALGSVHTVIFDKTGTLTEGKFAVTHLQLIGTSCKRAEMLALLALMEVPSSHPLSTTLVQAVKSEGVELPTNVTVQEHTMLPGEGVTALVDKRRIYVGNRRLFERLGMYNDVPIESKQITERLEKEQGGTVGFIGIVGDGIIGSYCATDVLRPEAKETVQSLLSAGVSVLMLTGDGSGAAKSVARQVGLPESSVHSQLLPEDKLRLVTDLKSNLPTEENNYLRYLPLFRKDPKILFCGDGVNDAPALACADIGVSMGEGAALAMEMSDVTLMDSNLGKLLYSVQMGTRVLQVIRENIVISIVCKIIVIGLTFGGYMTLLLAIASDVGVMLLVTLNGMKLLPQRGSAVVSLDEKGNVSPRFRRKRYDRILTDAFDSTDDNLEIV